MGWGGRVLWRSQVSSLAVPPRREKLRSRSDLYSNDDRNWDNPQGFSMGNSAATWEDLETPGTTYIHLEKVDTSRRMHIQRPTMVH